jgi:DNA-binding SARP family transcriptional activator
VTDELQIGLLGGARIARRGVPLTGFASRKVQALLCYLAVTGRPHHRAALAGLLWGEAPEAAAQTSLRQALANLRKLAGDHLLTDRATVALRAEGVRLDVARFLADAAPAMTAADPTAPGQPDGDRLAAAVALYQGDFLEGFVVHDAPAFDEWAVAQREQLRQMALLAIQTLADRHAARGEYAAGVALLTRLLAL